MPSNSDKAREIIQKNEVGIRKYIYLYTVYSANSQNNSEKTAMNYSRKIAKSIASNENDDVIKIISECLKNAFLIHDAKAFIKFIAPVTYRNALRVAQNKSLPADNALLLVKTTIEKISVKTLSI